MRKFIRKVVVPIVVYIIGFGVLVCKPATIYPQLASRPYTLIATIVWTALWLLIIRELNKNK